MYGNVYLTQNKRTMIKLKKIDSRDGKDFPDAIATLTVGSHEAQLTRDDLDKLQVQLNKFAIHSVSNSEAAVCRCGEKATVHRCKKCDRDIKLGY